MIQIFRYALTQVAKHAPFGSSCASLMSLISVRTRRGQHSKAGNDCAADRGGSRGYQSWARVKRSSFVH